MRWPWVSRRKAEQAAAWDAMYHRQMAQRAIRMAERRARMSHHRHDYDEAAICRTCGHDMTEMGG
jgi:hypothetical protein